MARTYRKYRTSVPAHIEAAASAAAQSQSSNLSSRSVPVYPGDKYDSVFLTPITIGYQNFLLDIDTGSGDLWAFTTAMPTSLIHNQTLYAPGYPAGIFIGLTWTATYGDGSSASGLVYQDYVRAGSTISLLQAVEGATNASARFVADFAGDGVMGLGFSTLNSVRPYQRQTFFDTIKAGLAKPLFAACLRHGKAGVWDFGYLNASLYTGAIAYAAVDAYRGWWEFNATGYSVGSGSVVAGTIDCMADTGTTLLYLPPAVVAAYYSQVAGAVSNAAEGGWIFPCTAVLPAFSLVIGGALQTVPGSYLNFGPADQRGNCFGGMQDNTGIGVSIVGDIFLKSQYVVFDESQSTPRIGFARQAGVVY